MRRVMFALAAAALQFGCDAADDVQVLDLPPLERPSPEARLRLPEVAGPWRFAGWEIVGNDSVFVPQTYPTLGDLDIRVQRLDSVAGTFALGGALTEIVGEVRRDGWVALVTVRDGAATGFLTARLNGDTLWLELTSVVPRDAWPDDSRAAFVRQPTIVPVAWVRGTRPGAVPPTDTITSPSPVRPGEAAPSPQIAPASGSSPAPPPSPVPRTSPPARSGPPPAPPPPAAPAPAPPPPPAPERPPPRLLGEPVPPR